MTKNHTTNEKTLTANSQLELTPTDTRTALEVEQDLEVLQNKLDGLHGDQGEVEGQIVETIRCLEAKRLTEDPGVSKMYSLIDMHPNKAHAYMTYKGYPTQKEGAVVPVSKYPNGDPHIEVTVEAVHALIKDNRRYTVDNIFYLYPVQERPTRDNILKFFVDIRGERNWFVDKLHVPSGVDKINKINLNTRSYPPLAFLESFCITNKKRGRIKGKMTGLPLTGAYALAKKAPYTNYRFDGELFDAMMLRVEQNTIRIVDPITGKKKALSVNGSQVHIVDSEGGKVMFVHLSDAEALACS